MELEEARASALAQQARRDELSERVGELFGRIGELERDVRIAELLERRESARVAIRAEAREWSVATLALWLLSRARERQERERQPEVIRGAARVFATMTAGRYPELLAPLGERRVDVRSATGRRKELGQLSRGTREQLLLALRLATVDDLSRRAAPLPLLMDDVLVDFDPERRQATARALVEFVRSGDERQVLLLTCHPETVETFRGVCPEVDVLRL